MEVISREIIKPSSPTPSHLKILPLSIIDHIFPHGYLPLLLFYENKSFQPNIINTNDDDNTLITTNSAKIREQRSNILKESLSQILSIYYPFAGRLMRENANSIECNDQGVTFLVTHFKHINLSNILQNPNEELINPLFADQLQGKIVNGDVANATFLAIQINHFACGGIAIAVCLSHKVSDGFSIGNFVKDWATVTRKSIILNDSDDHALIIPQFNIGASIFPCREDFSIPENQFKVMMNKAPNKVCKRRFVFESSKIESLKKKMVSQNVKFQNHPSRVQVVSALIYKCFVSTLRSLLLVNNNVKDDPNINVIIKTCFRFAVNLRTRIMSPPLPDKPIGNMGLDFPVCTSNLNHPMVEEEEEVHDLVRKIQQFLYEFRDKYSKNFERKDMSYFWEFLNGGGTSSTVATNDNNTHVLVNNVNITSWCNFSMYKSDFGWGRPVWVTTVGSNSKNIVKLLDTSDGKGIEAHVSMEEEAMALFERNEELLQFASINPSVTMSMA